MKLTPDDPNIVSPPSLLSVSEIALQIGRTPAAVAVAIRRLGIRPSLTGGNFRSGLATGTRTGRIAPAASLRQGLLSSWFVDRYGRGTLNSTHSGRDRIRGERGTGRGAWKQAGSCFHGCFHGVCLHNPLVLNGPAFAVETMETMETRFHVNMP